MQRKRIGILTSGSDRTGLDAAWLRSAAKLDWVHRWRCVQLDSEMVQTARAVEISFGD